MTIKEQIAQELESLTESELAQVAEYVTFLRFQARAKPIPVFDEAQLAALCADFEEEDREMAEEGMSDFAEGLMKEDAR